MDLFEPLLAMILLEGASVGDLLCFPVLSSASFLEAVKANTPIYTLVPQIMYKGDIFIL